MTQNIASKTNNRVLNILNLLAKEVETDKIYKSL
jgi:hypothetical protein